MSQDKAIYIKGARVHNLKNVDLEIPRNALVVITGLSGSGKSSLAFDTIYAEGQRRYMETLSSYARQFVGNMERPDVDHITGLSPVIAIEQKTTNKNPRSTVGTVTEISDFLRLLFARASRAYSPHTGEPMVRYSDQEIINLMINAFEGRRVAFLAPVVKGRKGHYREHLSFWHVGGVDVHSECSPFARIGRGDPSMRPLWSVNIHLVYSERLMTGILESEFCMDDFTLTYLSSLEGAFLESRTCP